MLVIPEMEIRVVGANQFVIYYAPERKLKFQSVNFSGAFQQLQFAVPVRLALGVKRNPVALGAYGAVLIHFR
jgi:hypothetical protein